MGRISAVFISDESIGALRVIADANDIVQMRRGHFVQRDRADGFDAMQGERPDIDHRNGGEIRRRDILIRHSTEFAVG